MNGVAVVLVLAAASIHAGWNRLLHGEGDRQLILALAAVAGGLLLVPAIVASPPLGVLALVALSALAELAYALCLSAAYGRGALSLAYPIGRGTAPLLITLGAWVVLGQRPTVLTISGAAALAGGLVLVAAGGSPVRRFSAVSFAMLTGIAIATYSVIDARAVQHTSPAGYLGVVLLLEGALLLVSIRPNRERVKQNLRPGVIVAVGMVAAYLLVLLAFQRANAGPVATLREVSVLVGLLISREKPARSVWVGGVLVVAGALCVAL